MKRIIKYSIGCGLFLTLFILLIINNVLLNDELITNEQYIITLRSNNHQKIQELLEENVMLLQAKDNELFEMTKALEVAFTENDVIQTLLNKDMEEWTPSIVLGMRDKLSSLPYGSWFDSGHYVTAPWGSKLLSGTHWASTGHKGVDIKPLSGVSNEIVKSPINGRVVTWGRNDRLFGNYLVIESMDGQFQIKLAHLSSLAIFNDNGTYDLYEGMTFKAGTRLARMGSTGNSTGPHLHIEYYMREDNNWRLLNASAILDYIGE